MIRSLEGQIAAVGENKIVVSVNGIGYLVNTPTNHQTFLFGENVFFHTHLAVRETALDLYGFIEKIDLDLFEMLLCVPKIGPKSALQISCQADTETLITSIRKNDPEYLHKMSGVGKKTAQNLVNHLNSKIESLALASDFSSKVDTSFSQNQSDAIDALITLGYDPKEARTYVLKENKEEDTKTLVQSVLKQIPLS